eukprot:GHRQ01038644.1.p3 GENE.GHRQ01038644.1~~GHRQ01038644.1.p3  ORF type:complete len:112 (+),score=30.89 GHRQ01038644.1:508-843(+)
MLVPNWVGGRRYHAKLPVRERNQAHRAFQCDDACVMVASLAFGMGIDKPNIRRIIHYVRDGTQQRKQYHEQWQRFRSLVVTIGSNLSSSSSGNKRFVVSQPRPCAQTSRCT